MVPAPGSKNSAADDSSIAADTDHPPAYRVAPWWLVQGTLEQKLRTFVREPVPYRVAVDLRGVPTGLFDLLLTEAAGCESPQEWCQQELPGISEWLVQSSGKELGGGGRLPRHVQPMSGSGECPPPELLTHLGQCGKLPGAVFYLMSEEPPPPSR